MGAFPKGKFFFIVVACYAVFACSGVIPVEGEDDRVGFGDLCLQDHASVQKLEEVVRDLSEVVSRLESKVSEFHGVTMAAVDGDYRKPGSDSHGIPARERDLVDKRGNSDEKTVGEVVVRDGGDGTRVVSVTKFSPVWSEKFQFASAMRLDDEVTCINVLPYRDSEGLSKYVAIGDNARRFYVISRNGDVLVGHGTSLESPVTAMVSYISVFKNESIVVTGHEDGELLLHKVWEVSNGEEWSTMSMKSIGKFGKDDRSGDAAAINILEVHHVGRTRYILSTDSRGRIGVFREDGSLHGSFMPSSRPLAFLKQRLLFLTETGAGSLDLRSMKLKESECEGLNKSVARTYVFDATERSKAYGYTSDGDLVHVLVLGDVGNFKCRVRFKKKFDMKPPMAFQAIKGYLLIVNSEKVFVYNVSTQHYAQVGMPRQIFSANLDEIRSSFLNHRLVSSDVRKREATTPLLASDREKLVVLGLGYGFIGMYKSNLPIHKSELNTMLWTSPVLFFIVFLFAAWHFFAKKKEALTSWGPDDPFTSVSAMANPPLGGNSGNRSLVESTSRNNDVMDLRGSSLRPPPRRYGSPSPYPTGTTAAFRTGTPDHTTLPTVDTNFRTASELKYRGVPLDPPGFPKRRDGMFANNQAAADDSNR